MEELYTKTQMLCGVVDSEIKVGGLGELDKELYSKWLVSVRKLL